MGKRGGSRKYKRSGRGVWGKNEYQSKKAREIGYSKEKRL